MKKIVLYLGGLLFGFSVQSQDISGKVPANASMVVKYAGEKLFKDVPAKKIDSYSFVKQYLFTTIGLDSTSSIEKTGIYLEKDIFQYLLMEDSSINFVTLMQLKDAAQFLALLQKNNKTEIITMPGKPYQFLSIDDSKYLGWNNSEAVLVYTTYTKPSDYYSPPYDAPAIDSVITVDSAAVAPPETEIEEEPAPPPPPSPKKKAKKGKPAKEAVPKKSSNKKPAKKQKEEIVIEEEVEVPYAEESEITDTAVSPDVYAYDYSYTDSIAQAKRDEWYKLRNAYVNGKQKTTADSIINVVFTGGYESITANPAYQKITDPSAHITSWFNYDNLMSKLWTQMGGGLYGLYGMPAKLVSNKNPGFTTGVNLYFEKDQLRVNQKMYSPDPELTKLGKDMFKNKQKNTLAAYINPDNIAYLSVSFNTAAVGKYYYKVLKQYLSNNLFLHEYAELIDIYIDLMEIVIDEEGIAELMPGNMVFVLHDMKPKTISYTDYEYDEDFNQKEIKKTKQELSPNFTIAFETKRADFMRKLVNVPVKYAEKYKFNYSEKGGYYELVFDGEKNPINNLFFIVKEDRVLITTSREAIEMTMKNNSYSLDAVTKKSVLKNNYSARLNTGRLLQQLGPEISTATTRSIRNYLEENLGNIQFESKYKDNMIQTNGTMAIKGSHTNSFEFLFNMIDKINYLLEKDKETKAENEY